MEVAPENIETTSDKIEIMRSDTSGIEKITSDDIRIANEKLILSLDKMKDLFKESEKIARGISDVSGALPFETFLKNYKIRGNTAEYDKIADDVKKNFFTVGQRSNPKLYNFLYNNKEITIDDIKKLYDSSTKITNEATRNRLIDAIAKSERAQEVILGAQIKNIRGEYGRLLQNMQDSEMIKTLQLTRAINYLREVNELQEKYELQLAKQDRARALEEVKSKWSQIKEFLQSINTKENWAIGTGGTIGIIGIISSIIAAVSGRGTANEKTKHDEKTKPRQITIPNKKKGNIIRT